MDQFSSHDRPEPRVAYGKFARSVSMLNYPADAKARPHIPGAWREADRKAQQVPGIPASVRKLAHGFIVRSRKTGGISSEEKTYPTYRNRITCSASRASTVTSCPNSQE